MEKNLYLSAITESYVEVIACTASENGQFKLELDKTPFHPQGGGQPCDTGYISKSEVMHVAFDDGKIIHLCKQAVALGQAYAKVDIQRRQFHSRLHSAGHLIGHILENYGWRPIKAQHWPSDARVQFVATENCQSIESVYLETLIQTFVNADLPTEQTINENGFRQIQFGELKAYPCGGTHVQSLFEIGTVEILKMEMKKGKLTVHYALATGSTA